jgi:hypothetical protein
VVKPSPHKKRLITIHITGLKKNLEKGKSIPLNRFVQVAIGNGRKTGGNK